MTVRVIDESLQENEQRKATLALIWTRNTTIKQQSLSQNSKWLGCDFYGTAIPNTASSRTC